jgi:hypothetical protein
LFRLFLFIQTCLIFENRTFGREQSLLRKPQIRSTKNTMKHEVHKDFFSRPQRAFCCAKISASIYLQLKYTINICENLRNLRETENRFRPRKGGAQRTQRNTKFTKIFFKATKGFLLRKNICENLPST